MNLKWSWAEWAEISLKLHVLQAAPELPNQLKLSEP